MGTRATYRSVPSDKWQPTTTVYIHWDGYPEGAAAYFYQTLMHENARGTFTDRMLRAIENAESTRGHEAHGDTEWRYDIEGNGPGATVRAYERDDWEKPTWPLRFSGTLAEFVEKHRENIADWTGLDYHPFREVEIPGRGRPWLNETTAAQRLEHKHGPLHHLRVWSQSKAPGVARWTLGNWHSMCSELRAIADAFPSLMTDEIRAFLDEDEREYAAWQESQTQPNRVTA